MLQPHLPRRGGRRSLGPMATRPKPPLPALGPGLTGRVLAATPTLKAGPFAQSVVLICEHTRQHAFGIIVNKPIRGLKASAAVAELQRLSGFDADKTPVHYGGPCATNRGFVLHTADYEGEATMRVAGKFGLTSTRDALSRIEDGGLDPHRTRIIAGHLGWSSGQLDDELRRLCWVDIEADSDLVFGPADDMWQRAMARSGLSDINLSALRADTASGAPRLN